MQKRTMRSSLVGATLAFFTALVSSGCQPTASTNGDAPKLLNARAKGRADAKASLAKGTLRMKEYPPMPSPAEHGEYIKLLKEKCNCDYEVVPMNEYSKAVHEDVNGWNDVMRGEIQNAHGPAIFEELHAEARKRWEVRTKK